MKHQHLPVQDGNVPGRQGVVEGDEEEVVDEEVGVGVDEYEVLGKYLQVMVHHSGVPKQVR